MTEQKNGKSSSVLQLLRDRGKRPLVIRYLAPAVTVCLAVLLAALPMIVFHSVGGDSDAHSLFYWQHVNFFGEGARWGSLEFLQNASPGDQYLGLYRAVTTLYLISVLFFVIGAVLSLLLSLSSAMLLIPFFYHHLLAYFYTTYQSFPSVARFRPIDPLILMILLFSAQVFLMLWAKSKEKALDYVIFRAFDAQKEARKKKLLEEREWEEEIRSDANREPDLLRAEKEVDREASAEAEPKNVQTEHREPVDAESLFGVSFVLSDEETPRSAERVSETEEVQPTEMDADEMRRSLQSLFADDGSENEEKL